MQSYLEIKVPINNKAKWLGDLRKLLADIPVRWQNRFHHITMAFLCDATKEQREQARQIIGERLQGVGPMRVTFDKVDAFRAGSGNMHIVNVTSSNPDESFMKLTNAIRADLQAAGLRLESDFKLHVTLGRVPAESISIERLQEKLLPLTVSAFPLDLSLLEYWEFRGQSIGKWELK